MYRSKEHPFMIADVDRLVVGEDAGLECKTASAYNADKWADGNIPLHYVMQCYHYMAVTGKGYGISRRLSLAGSLPTAD